MKFEHTQVFNLEGAFRGMRNPLNSWDRSDSKWHVPVRFDEEGGPVEFQDQIGEKDMELAQRLIKGGSPHRKFLRQILVSVDITAPLFWWKEADQNKVGTVTDSCSTMHKVMEKPFTPDMFECSEMRGFKRSVSQHPNPIDEDTELWKVYPSDENYLVSNQGRVKHLSYENTNGRCMKERILNGSIHDDGYAFISICLGHSKYKQVPKHRMVAETWIENPNNKPEVNHIDGNKLNNSIDNLEWCTSSENSQHAVDNHLQPNQVKTYLGKIPAEQRQEIIDKYSSGEFSIRELGREYNLTYTTVRNIVYGIYKYGVGIVNEYDVFCSCLDALNSLREEYIETHDQAVWKTLIVMLPESWLQKRTMTFNYEVIRQMCYWRKGHKLSEWQSFIDWAHTLPYADELIFYGLEEE